MKNKPLFDLKKDLWVLILDIIAVNISYFMAIVLRYYLRYHFVPEAAEFLDIFWKFAPIYTVLAIAVFLLFRLYNGMWAYAGLGEMNRIVLGSIVASVLYVLGTSIIFRRMPTSYYVVGAAIQLVLVVIIRYAYRIIEIEKQKAASKNKPVQRLMLIGSDITAQKVLGFLTNEESFRPVVVVDEKSRDKSLRGLPLWNDAAKAAEQYAVNCVLIADPMLSDSKRDELKALCKDKGLELYDYTGFMKNLSGSLSLTDVMRVVSSPAGIKAGDKNYSSFEQAMQELKGRYSVVSIKGDKLTIEVRPAGEGTPSEDWIKQYEQESGEEVSFF